MNIRTLSVFGLGKLGATMVGCFADAGFSVIGVDVNAGNVERVSRGEAPVPEPGLQELYTRNRERIRATMDVNAAVLESEASFIIVPTPSLPEGEFFTSIARKVAESIGRVLKGKAAYHLVVLTSTVLPGATERDIKTALEEESGKICGRDFGLCYSPEFIAIGDVIRGLTTPDFFLVGAHDAAAGDALEAIYRRMQGCAEARRPPPIPIVRMNLVNAELTKIAVNTFVTSKISFANTLCRICSRLPGGDAREVTRAVGLDKRIGSRYLSPGATFGGPCFPRDNRAFEWFSRSVGEDAPLARATDAVNRQQADFLTRLVVDTAGAGAVIGLLGLSYKPGTNLMEGSVGVTLAVRLIGRGFRVIGFDPWVAKHGATEPVPGLEWVDSAAKCREAADVVALCTAHEEFLGLKPADLAAGGRHRVLVDVWGILRGPEWAPGESYVAPGVGRAERGQREVEGHRSQVEKSKD